MGWKYVMMEVRVRERADKTDGITVQMPIIFPDKLVHSMMFAAMKAVLNAHGFDHVGVASAGMIEHIDIEIGHLGGESETLGLASKPEDRETIVEYSYDHGIKT